MAKKDKDAVTGNENAALSPEPDQEAPLQPSTVAEAEDPGRTALKETNIAYGEVLIISLDQNGNETGNPFKVSAGTYDRYYNDETKFRLKKNHE